jgi:hypothetical protein
MSYYHVDAGFFPTPVKVCFTKKDFHKILKEHNIPIEVAVEAGPLVAGIAETHAFNKFGDAFVVVIFNLELIQDDLACMAGVVAHECSHVIERILEHIGEDVTDFGEETRAYLMQHIVEQIFQGCLMEMHKNAKRKVTGKATVKAGQAEGGTVPEVGVAGGDGGAGQDSNPSGEGDLRGVEGLQGGAVTATKAGHTNAPRRGGRGITFSQRRGSR